MGRLSIDKLEPGMVLLEAATGPRGNVLLGEGIELNEKHIRALKTWGVSSVAVEVDEEPGEDQEVDLSPEQLAAAEEATAPRFRHAPCDHPMMRYLFDYVVRQAAIEAKRRSGA